MVLLEAAKTVAKFADFLDRGHPKRLDRHIRESAFETPARRLVYLDGGAELVLGCRELLLQITGIANVGELAIESAGVSVDGDPRQPSLE